MKISLFATSIMTSAVFMPAEAWAQDPSAADPAPATKNSDEIIVTAQKREQNIQDVGSAISVLGSEALDTVGKRDISAITSLMPGIQSNQYSSSQVVFNIRGVSQNDFADSQEGPIAFYNDEVYVASLGAISGQNFDLERVETLRGPQGTLFGRNATGGLVQVFTARPTHTLDGYATLTLGSYNQIGTDAAISGPLSDSVRGRLSFSTNRNSGYITNRVGRDKGTTELYAGRVQIESDIGAGGKLLLKGQLVRNVDESGGNFDHLTVVPNEFGLGVPVGPNEDPYDTCMGCDAFGYAEPDNNPFTTSSDRRGSFDRTYWSGTARYTQDLGKVTLTSITDFQHLKKAYLEDSDASPNPLFNYDARQNLDQFSQELRVSGASADLNWVAGAYYFNLDTKNAYKADFPLFFDTLDYFTRTRTKSEAIFGQIEYSPVEKLKLILGARYTWEQKKLNYSIFNNGLQFADVSPGSNPDIADRDFNNYSGKIAVEFTPSDNALFYASVNRGTKGGGFGTLGYVPPDLDRIDYGQEVLTNYEVGYKLTLLDRAMRFNGAAFYYDYDGYQAFSTVGLTQFITNNKAHIWGAEVDLSGRIIHGLSYSLFGAYLDSKVYDITLPSGDVRDRRMPQAPKWSFGGNARYEWPMLNGDFAASSDWKWNSSQFFTTFNAPVDRQKAYAVGNARLEYKPDRLPLEFALFVQNVTDKRYFVYALDLSVLSFAQRVYGRPRWFGGSVTVRLR